MTAQLSYSVLVSFYVFFAVVYTNRESASRAMAKPSLRCPRVYVAAAAAAAGSTCKPPPHARTHARPAPRPPSPPLATSNHPPPSECLWLSQPACRCLSNGLADVATGNDTSYQTLQCVHPSNGPFVPATGYGGIVGASLRPPVCVAAEAGLLVIHHCSVYLGSLLSVGVPSRATARTRAGYLPHRLLLVQWHCISRDPLRQALRSRVPPLGGGAPLPVAGCRGGLSRA